MTRKYNCTIYNTNSCISYSSLPCSHALRGIESVCLDVTLLSCWRFVLVIVKIDEFATTKLDGTFSLFTTLPLLSDTLQLPPIVVIGQTETPPNVFMVANLLLGERINALGVILRCLKSNTACNSVRPE